jgi:hypothetical protein
LCVLAAPLLAREPVPAAPPTPRPAVSTQQVQTHESYISDLRAQALDLADIMSIFRHVFSSLPPTVKVYPTENYYYFRFETRGREIWGNLRLDAEDREKGLLDFAYFAASNRPEHMDDLLADSKYKQLSSTDGVLVRRVRPLVYEVTFEHKTVRFELNDLPQTPPGFMGMLPSEHFVERTFDDSGFQFVLIFDTKTADFRFVLDEEAPLPDVLVPLADGLLLGRLTGFAFYDDKPRRRKILIAVDAENMKRNNYFDGPFDQLADNFVKDDTRKMLMEEAYPYARGRIDRRGVFLSADGSNSGNRLALTPYYTYSSLDDLRLFYSLHLRQQADEQRLLSALTHDYKKDVPGATTPLASGNAPAPSPKPAPSDDSKP